MVRQMGLEPIRSRTRTSNVPVCQFQHCRASCIIRCGKKKVNPEFSVFGNYFPRLPFHCSRAILFPCSERKSSIPSRPFTGRIRIFSSSAAFLRSNPGNRCSFTVIRKTVSGAFSPPFFRMRSLLRSPKSRRSLRGIASRFGTASAAARSKAARTVRSATSFRTIFPWF